MHLAMHWTSLGEASMRRRDILLGAVLILAIANAIGKSLKLRH